jgi:hypothetical protein
VLGETLAHQAASHSTDRGTHHRAQRACRDGAGHHSCRNRSAHGSATDGGTNAYAHGMRPRGARDGVLVFLFRNGVVHGFSVYSVEAEQLTFPAPRCC